MSDLTWQQLQTAIAVPNAITLSGGKVIIDPALVTGDAYDSLSDTGVLEFIYKLLGFGLTAQTTINQNLPVGSRLNSFANTTFGAVAQQSTGQASLTATRQITVTLSLDQNNPVGLNI